MSRSLAPESQEKAALAALAALPYADRPRAAAFARAAEQALRAGDLKPSGLELSLSFGRPAFRALVNLACGRRGLESSERLIRACALALGLSRFEQLALGWLEDPDHEAYFGLSDSPKEQRSKLYFRAVQQRADFSSLLPRLGAPTALERPPHPRAVLSMIGVDLRGDEPLAFKSYWTLPAAQAAARFDRTALAKAIKEGPAPLTCYARPRFSPSGEAQAEALYVDPRPETAAALAGSLARARDDAAQGRLLDALLKRFPLEIKVLSETAGPAPAAAVYFSIIAVPAP